MCLCWKDVFTALLKCEATHVYDAITYVTIFLVKIIMSVCVCVCVCVCVRVCACHVCVGMHVCHLCFYLLQCRPFVSENSLPSSLPPPPTSLISYTYTHSVHSVHTIPCSKGFYMIRAPTTRPLAVSPLMRD